MELFDKMNLSNDPLIHNLLLNKNDFIRFLKTDKIFNRLEKLNIYNEESKEREILNYYYEHRNSLKVKKYYKILRLKIEKYFHPSKLYLEKLEKVNKTMFDLQDFEKQLFMKDFVSEVDSDDSEAIRKAEHENRRKQKVFIKEKSLYNNRKFINPLVNPKKIVDFIKENSDLITRYMNFTKRKKISSNKEIQIKKTSKVNFMNFL